jgi:long-subunit fatty acid transport protein
LYEQEQYQTLIEDNDQNVASIGFDYQLSRASSVGVQASRQERKFDSDVDRNDFTVTSFGANYRYTPLSMICPYRFFFIVDESESEAETLTYDERISGISLTYTF